MNWMIQTFDELKARFEAHIPATNQRLENLERRVAELEAVVHEGQPAKGAATP